MKTTINRISTLNMSKEDWLAYRMNGIGASEAGTIMGLNKYLSSIALFDQKVGRRPQWTEENESMFWGKIHEETVADAWQYWDGTPESMIKNKNSGEVMRKCRRINAYLVNPDTPWLFASLDRTINRNEEKDEGALEIKTISGWSAKQWEAEIPPSYVVQLQQQLHVADFAYGELALLKDGRQMEVIPFERNQVIIDGIIRQTKEFWERVVYARKVIAEEGLDADLTQFEPEPDGSEAYADYLKERYKDGGAGTISGTEFHLALAKKHIELIGQRNVVEAEITKVTNQMKDILRDFDEIDFGALGKIQWKANAKGVRTFNNYLKKQEI
jgi:putative phage-type endonuclease